MAGQAQPRHTWASPALLSDGDPNERAELGGRSVLDLGWQCEGQLFAYQS